MQFKEKKSLEKTKYSSPKTTILPGISKLILNCQSLWSRNKFRANKNFINSVGPSNIFRYVALSKYENSTKNIWYDCLMSCESRVKGSGKYASVLLCKKEDINFIGRVPSKVALRVAIKSIRNDDSRNLIKNPYEELSSKSIIQIYKTKSSRTSITVENNLILESHIEPNFQRMVGNKSHEFNDCKISVIDGSVASVSELNKLLERNFSSKEPFLLFARGFYEEVVSTLATNFKLKKLNVVPIVYGNDINSINFVSDISAISGCVPISRDFGDNIGTSITDESKYGFLRSVSYSKNKFTAVSDLEYTEHISKLKLSLEKEQQEDKQKIIARRISNLTSERIEVRIPESKLYMHEDCDDFIKTYRNIIESGLVHLKGFGALPVNCYHVAREVTNVFKQNVESIGCAICLDEKPIQEKNKIKQTGVSNVKNI